MTSFDSLGTATRAAIGLALLAAATAPALASGCGGETACLAWDASKGACPDRDKALAAMTVACGEHRVQEVQSDGELVDGDACCYEVRQTAGAGFCVPAPSGPAGPGAGPTSGTGTTTSGGCSGIIGGDCGACVEPACCNELLACTASQACVDCFNSGTCAGDSTTTQADQLVGCMAAAQCPGDSCGASPTPPPLCSAPAASPSGGKCVMLGGQVLCNPITNEGCNAAAGEICDRGPSGGFQCAAHPLQNAICNGCGASGWCELGHTCYVSLCAKLCCDDSDCDTGVCTLGAPIALSPPVGICVPGTPSGSGG
jgi:hypothetical protein